MWVNNEGRSVLTYPKYSRSYTARSSPIPNCRSFFQPKWQKKNEKEQKKLQQGYATHSESSNSSLSLGKQLNIDTRTTTSKRLHPQPPKYSHRRTPTQKYAHTQCMKYTSARTYSQNVSSLCTAARRSGGGEKT